jgi:hypothetical protein
MVVRCHSLTHGQFEEEKGLHHDMSVYMLETWPLEAHPCFSNTNDFLKVEKCPLKARVTSS